jgi:hypothetical protein
LTPRGFAAYLFVVFAERFFLVVEAAGYKVNFHSAAAASGGSTTAAPATT